MSYITNVIIESLLQRQFCLTVKKQNSSNIFLCHILRNVVNILQKINTKLSVNSKKWPNLDAKILDNIKVFCTRKF